VFRVKSTPGALQFTAEYVENEIIPSLVAGKWLFVFCWLFVFSIQIYKLN